MPQRKGLLAPQNTFLDTIATRFDGTHSNFVLGNAEAKEYPIVYCSDGFLLLTKYSRANVMSRGSECRFLCGPETNEEEKSKISNAFHCKKEFKTEIIFYKRTGEKFLCLLDVVPIKNEKGQVVLFLVSHKDLTPKDKKKNNSIENGCKSSISDMGDNKTSQSNNNTNCEEGEDEDVEEIQTTSKYQRRRSRAVLYHLQGQYNGKRKNKSKLNRFQNFNGAESLPEYKVDEMKKACFIFQHYGPIKIIWDWALLFATFYIALMVPYHAAVQVDHANKNSVVLDIIVEILFILDVVFNFRTTYVNCSGQIVYEQRRIAVNYIKGWFIVDLIAAIPFDILNIVFGNQDHTTKPQIHLMKLTRMLRLARLMQKIDRYYQYSAVVLALLIGMFGLCAHWLACIWYYIGLRELHNNNTKTIGWMFELSEKLQKPYSANWTGGPEISNFFITALYFTCSSLTSVGFGNVSANTDSEKLFSICVMLMGALMHAAIFGNVTALIQRMYSRRTAYQSKHRDLKEFIRTHRIPKKLKQRMLEFFQTTWALNRGIDVNDVLKDFSDGLRGDIAIHLNREVLGLKVFEKANQGCLKALAQKIKTAFCTPGEYLVHTGDILHYIYFVCSGSLEILENNEVVALLGKNDWFGTYVDHLQSYSVIRSRCDVKALTYCDLQCIELTGIQNIFLLYPSFKAVFSKFLYQDLSFNIQEGANHKFDCDSSANSGIAVLPSISEDEDEYSIESESCLESPVHSEENTCLIQEATNSDHIVNSLKQQKQNQKTKIKRKQASNELSVNLNRSTSSPVLLSQSSDLDLNIMKKNHEKLDNEPLSRDILKHDIARNRRRSFELSRKRQTNYSIYSAESDSSNEDHKWQKSFRHELNGMKKHVERLESNFILMNKTVSCMSRNIEEILSHINNQNLYNSDLYTESNQYIYGMRPTPNKHLRKPYHHTPLLKVVSASPIHENEERSPHIIINERVYENNDVNDDDEARAFLDATRSNRLPNITFQSSPICENSLLHINTNLLESKLSPRSASSGFVSNQEDISPKSSQYYIDVLKSSKKPIFDDQKTNEEHFKPSTELNHQELMRKINQICRMQSLPESAYPPVAPYTQYTADNPSSGDISNAKYFTHRRISSPIPFIRSTNL